MKNDIEFRKHMESCNPYMCIQNVSMAARELADKYDNKISHSEALTYVIHDSEPDKNSLMHLKNEYEENYIREQFCYIDDKEICNAVYDSFYESKKHNNLIFIYNNLTDLNKQARVRVITRTLWYTLLK